MARDDDDTDDEPRSKRRKDREENGDDDDRPRKKRTPPDEEDEPDDRPRKKRAPNDDDDTFESEDDRPRKKRTPRDDDEDDEDDRPRKKRSSRDDEDDDDERRPKKKKKAGLLPLLLACAIVSLAVGGICMLMNCGISIRHSVIWVDVLRFQAFGRMPGSLKFLIVFFTLTNFLTALAAIALLGAGILLMLRKSAGKLPALGAPIALFLLPIVEIITTAIILDGFHFRGWHITLLILTIVLGLGAGICNFIALFNQGVNKALR